VQSPEEKGIHGNSTRGEKKAVMRETPDKISFKSRQRMPPKS